MGVNFPIVGSAYDTARGYEMPQFSVDPSLIKGMYLLGGGAPGAGGANAALAYRNLVNLGTPAQPQVARPWASVAGTPTVANDFVQTDGVASSIDTQILDGAGPWTYIVACQMLGTFTSQTTAASIAGTLRNSTKKGMGLLVGPSSGVAQLSAWMWMGATPAAQFGSAINVPNFNSPKIFALRYTPGSNMKVFDVTDGLTVQNNWTDVYVPNTEPVLLGGLPMAGSANNGPIKLFGAIIAKAALSDDDIIVTAAARLRGYCARRGITL